MRDVPTRYAYVKSGGRAKVVDLDHTNSNGLPNG